MSTHYIVFDRVRILGANAVSSPLTYGFPSIGGFLGAIHALQRSLPEDCPLRLGGVMIANHECSPHLFRSSKYSDATFIQTRNPIKENGKTAPIIEEGKVDLLVSLVVEVLTGEQIIYPNQMKTYTQILQDKLFERRIAGGSILEIGEVKWFSADKKESVLATLLPAYVLLNADDIFLEIIEDESFNHAMQQVYPNHQPTHLDVVLATAQFFNIPLHDEEKNQTTWSSYNIRHGRGWLVPLHRGYQAISPLYEAGQMSHTRNPEYPAQYVEAIYGLGQWVFPNKLNGSDLDRYFWHYHHFEQLFLFSQYL